MAEEIKKDSDAGTQSQIGVGKVDQATKALHEIQPNWVEDGLGIVGPQRQRVRPREEGPRRMDFNLSNDNRNPPVATGTIIVQTGAFSGGYLGTVNGVTTITLDERYFLIQDNGGGEVLISLNTTTCP